MTTTASIHFPPSVFLVLPAYNKGHVIAACIEGLVVEARKAGIRLEVLVVDDLSTDDTADVVERLRLPGVSAVQMTANLGKGAAVRRGMSMAPSTFDYVGFFDADLDIHPRAVPELVSAIRTNERAVGAIASKVHPGSDVRYSLFRRTGSLVFSIVARALIGVRFRDTQTGAKMFECHVGRVLADQCVIDGFAFDVELLARASRSNHQIIEAPVELRIELGSTVAMGNVLQAFRDLWKVRSALRSGG